ncbi:MAG TPA: tRNA 2-thiouridine(34) synthase MnmA [Candidatus Peribacteria bacterium]|nr:tRNA 2-thiouridine(34) synthase MnmA [Candidatus Peribacteria bacterium]
MRILLAMSGGIDSSVVAHLLKEQGHDVVGVRFTLWSDPLAPALAEVLPSKCCNAQTAARARTVAKQLGIPLHIVDLADEFKQNVVDPFLAGYAKGLSPNPCIGCNRTIKFGKLLELCKELGCDKLATGHYARTATETLSDGSERHLLLEAVDGRKDQSYYLYGLTQEQLKHCVFPLGAMRKPEVYALAAHFKVPYSDSSYRESQDLCFFPEKTPQEFLKRHLTDAIAPGPIVRRDGTVLGTHQGLPLYTVGQRRGLKVGGQKIPLEVVAKDGASNSLIVEPKGRETVRELHVNDLRFVSWKPADGEATEFECRVRSLAVRQHGSILVKNGAGVFTFDVPQPPQSPGQSLVLYRGEEVVGGGVILV